MLFPLIRQGNGPPASSPVKAQAGAGDAPPPASTAAAPPTPPAAAGVDRRRPIAAGDTVIVYESHTSMKAVTVTEEATFSNRFGMFRVKVRSGGRRRERNERICAP
jgi:hypothetical protein